MEPTDPTSELIKQIVAIKDAKIAALQKANAELQAQLDMVEAFLWTLSKNK